MDVFTALAEPHRRAILDLLQERERAAGEIVETFPELTQPAVSRHLRVLREVGLVEVQVAAQKRIYRLQPARLSEIDHWLQRYRIYWKQHLDSLEQHLAKSPKKDTAR